MLLMKGTRSAALGVVVMAVAVTHAETDPFAKPWDYTAEGQNVQLNFFGTSPGPVDPWVYDATKPRWWNQLGEPDYIHPGYQAFEWSFPTRNYATGFMTDFGSAQNWIAMDIGKSDCHGSLQEYRIRYSLDAEDWTVMDLTDATISEGRGASGTTISLDTRILNAPGTDGLLQVGKTDPSDRAWLTKIALAKSFRARYIRFELREWTPRRSNSNVGFSKWVWYVDPTTTTTTVTTTTGTTTTTTTIEGHDFHSVHEALAELRLQMNATRQRLDQTEETLGLTKATLSLTQTKLNRTEEALDATTATLGRAMGLIEALTKPVVVPAEGATSANWCDATLQSCPVEVKATEGSGLSMKALGGELVFETARCAETNLCELAQKVDVLVERFGGGD